MSETLIDFLGNRRQRKDIETASFVCISMLATAVGQALTKYVHELLDLMFACGLSEPLVSALSNLAERIKPLSTVIQGKRKEEKKGLQITHDEML